MFRNIISKMFNGGGTMKISKKNLLAFARNHTYGEEMAKGCRSKETINFHFVEFMFGETVGEIRTYKNEDILNKVIIPIYFISDDSLAIFDNIDEFHLFIKLFFIVEDYDIDTRLPLRLFDYYENKIKVDYMYFETTLHTSVYLNYGIITERFLINDRVIKEKNHGEETENV